jgi:hypothetical protein
MTFISLLSNRRGSRGAILLIIAFCVQSLLYGCVANRSYRRGGEVVPKQMAKQLPASSEPLDPSMSDCGKLPEGSCIPLGKVGLKPKHFYLSYIEFDDMGELWSIGDLNAADQRLSGVKQSQLENAISSICRAKKQAESNHTELVVITFIHGWHNNASEYDERQKNLAGFETILQGLSYRGSAIDDAKPPVVVGVFIAWRGQVVAGDVVTSYWNRRDAARLVGGPSMTEAISRLMFETKGPSPSPNPTNGCRTESESEIDRNSHFIIIGHSFGARVLEHAITQPMLAIILERQSQADACVVAWNQRNPNKTQLRTISFEPPADLVVFLNAANDSFETKAVIEAFKRSHLCASHRSLGDTNPTGCDEFSVQGPLMISITSQGDWATGKVMPFAQTLSIPGKAFRPYDPNVCALGQLSGLKQTYFFRHNDGNVPEMQSHNVQYQDDDKSKAECANNEWPFFNAEVSGHNRCFKIIRVTDAPHAKCPETNAGVPWNNTPFYVMKVPSTLIANHNDIFQDGTVELLNSLVLHYIVHSSASITAPASSPNQR